MFFFPISTDAPVYHWPFATLGLIVANVLVYLGMASGSINPEAGWVLTHGDGLHPAQWLLSMFTHGGFMHLFGNMVFLWVFGLVVEGKLGWQRFLVCYLGVGLTQSAFEQVVMLGAEGPSGLLGASSAIYGVMAMAAVWAPKNEVTFFGWFFAIAGTFDVPIGMLAGFYVGLDLLWVVLSAGTMSSSWLHVTGAMVGFPLGILLLKRGAVDCEGWDMFHVWKGDYGATREIEAAQAEAAASADQRRLEGVESQLAAAHKQFRVYLAQGNAGAALTLHRKMAGVGGGLDPATDELRVLVAGLHKAGRFTDSAPFMALLIDRAPELADLLRLKLAQICVADLERPGRAADLLDAIDPESLSDNQRRLAERIRRKIEQMQAAGVVELDDGAW